MRIIAGSARGRKLFGPGHRIGKPLIRPTADRARESLFNIVTPEVLGARVLDLFAGTGAMGLEALSRGAGSALLVDCNRTAIDLILKNIRVCFLDGPGEGSPQGGFFGSDHLRSKTAHHWRQGGREKIFRLNDSAGRLVAVAQRDLNKGLFFFEGQQTGKWFQPGIY